MVMKKLLDKLFPKRVLFVILSPNFAQIKDVESGKSIERKSLISFSNERLIVSDFKVAEGFIRTLIDELLNETSAVGKPIKIVLQIRDKNKPKVADVERRIYQDVFEHAGAAYFWLIDHQNSVSDNEILDISK